MKKLLLLAALFMPAALFASSIFIEVPAIQEYDLSSGVEHVVAVGNGIEIRIADAGDQFASVFNITVVRLNAEATEFVTLCENQLKVPFGSEATLFFSKIGVSMRFVATVPTAITPDPIEDPTNPDPNGTPTDPVPDIVGDGTATEPTATS